MIENYLSKLGTMYQKRKRASFKNDLRAQLLNKALELNEQPAKRGFTWPDLQHFFVKRFAPASAAVLLVALVFQFLIPSGGLIPGLVNIAEAKDYYTLEPQVEDSTGVAAESSFLLSSKGSLDVEEVENVLKINPAAELSFEQVSDSAIMVTPTEALDPGTVYAFELEAYNLADSPYPKEFSWAYEISDGFRITGTLPGNQEAGVPTNSGIEIYFTHHGVNVEEFEAAFSIVPAISGSFEVNGKTGIFAPKGGLQEGTIYTVTVNGELSSGEGGQALEEDISFVFETDASTRSETNLNFVRSVYEFSPDEEPNMQIYYWENDTEELTAEVSVYRYKNGEDYFEALQSYSREAPSWAYYQRSNYDIPVNGLEKILNLPEFSTTEDSGYWISLPDNLDEGFYVVEALKNDAIARSFVQISDQAVYLNLNQANTLLWVNSTETGEAIANAKVSLVGGETVETDDEGVATFENLYDVLDLEMDEDHVLYFIVETDDATTYYEAPFYRYGDRSNENAWEFLQTDRSTYQPSDTVHYWGYIRGREAPIEEEAELTILEGYFWTYGDFPTSYADQIVYENRSIELKDGEAFEGMVDIENLTEGSYSLVISQGDTVLSSTEFYVQSYTKPAYEIVLDASKTALFEGDTTHITVRAQFFDGTPVSDVELRIDTPNNTVENRQTDENGEYSFDWVASVDDCNGSDYCSLYDSRYMTVTPVQEELGEVSKSMEFKVFRSSSMIDEDGMEFTNDAFSFQSFNVDLASIDYDETEFGYYYDFESVRGESDAQSTATVTVMQVDWVKTEVGEYYDENDKVVRKKYEYNREVETIAELALTPNGDGEYSYEPALSETYDYDILIELFDQSGRSYKDRASINNGASYNSYWGSSFGINRQGSADYGAEYVEEGEEVLIEVLQSSPEDPLEGRFLFMENQAGLQNYAVTSEDFYRFEFGEEHVPSVTIQSVLFDGENYRASYEEYLYLDTTDRSLELSVTADKESYEPGETVTLNVEASERAYVNLYLVDEAYYALFAENLRDPLNSLYSSISADIDYTYLSHRMEVSDSSGDKGGCFIAGTQILMADGSSKAIEDIEKGDLVLTRNSALDGNLVPVEVLSTVKHTVNEYLLVNENLGVTQEHVLFINGQWQVAGELKIGDVLLNSSGETVTVESIRTIRETMNVYNFQTADKHTYFANDLYVHNDKGESREDFEDTAFFTVVETDAAGKATVSFELPDNITSWKVSAAAIGTGEEIHAGLTSISIPVSKDLFVTPILNSVYLEGDEPFIPVRAYGDALSSGASVSFSAESEALGLESSVSGTAFETSYISLPELTTGDYKLSTTAEADGESDTVILPFTVIASHLSSNRVELELLEEGSSLSGSETERTEVHFMNNELGILYGLALDATYNNGDRVDEALAQTLGAEWLNTYFDAELTVPEFDIGAYQEVIGEGDGGIALLPYADSDLELSAKLAALAPEHTNKQVLSNYFEGILNSKDRTLSEKILALYGLAGLGEAYLTELNYFVSHFDLSDEDKLFAALAYSEYKQDLNATVLFLEIYDEGDARWNALLATVAETIGSDLSESLWESALDAEDDESPMILLEKMLYAQARLEMGVQKTVFFDLNGERIELSGADVLRKSYLPEELEALEIKNVNGEVAAISFYQSPAALEEISLDDSISITRTYKVDGKAVETLHVGDLVEVHFSIETSLDDVALTVKDHLPSGLQTATWANAANAYSDDAYRNPYDQDGQTLSFYVWCADGVCHNSEFYYLARVINPGSFILEPATVQNLDNLESINISGNRSTLTID